MSSQELVSKIERLSPDDFQMVIKLIDRLSGNSNSLPVLSEEEIIDELKISIKRSDMGYTKPARNISQAMRHKYVF